MRDFFIQILNNLEKLTGHKQLERLMASKDSKQEINDLLDVLCRTSDLFPLIPKNDQKAIISHAVISDGDFIGLNAKFVYKSLQAHRDRFFKEAAHIPTPEPEGYKPVDDQRRAEWLKEWEKTLQGFSDKATTQSHVQELVAKLPPKEKGLNYPSTKAEDVIKRELHIEYIKAMNATGLPREQWESEQTWISKLKK